MNVLLCVDRDAILDDLLVAFRWGVRLGPADRLLVLHVVPKVAWLHTIGRLDPTVEEQVRELPKRADAVLSEAVGFLGKEGLRAEPVLREGHPAEEILRLAREEPTELIVIGALGRKDKENFLLGSVSQRVKREADRDIFIVKEGGPSAKARFTAIGCVDGSRESAAALRSFANKMQTVLADVHLLRVVESTPSGPTEGPDEVLESGRAILEESGLVSTTEIRHGRPASEILACARERRARVIALGARGLGAVSSAVMGSVSARMVRHAPCAVFCGRSTE